MTPPPFLLGSTLIFWGWQSHLLLFALPMALILEGAAWIDWRWTFSDKDFNRVTDFTSLSLFIATIYILILHSIRDWMTLLSWFPILFFILIVAQTYSTQGTVKLSSLFLSLRRSKNQKRINLIYPYMLICLLSSSISNDIWFFIGVSILIAWALWAARPKRYSMMIFGILLIIATTLGHFGHTTLYYLHTKVDEFILNWLDNRLHANRDPYRQDTAIGDIRQLKLSDQIVLRVDTSYPMRLREASYNIYFNKTWIAKNTAFKNIIAIKEGETWEFSDTNETAKKINISAYLRKGRGMLALPHGTHQVSRLVVLSVQHNKLGAVKVNKGPGLIQYTAHFTQTTPLDMIPTKHDLLIPKNEQAHITELAQQLNLYEQTPKQVLNTLTTFFQQNFKYSLNLTAPVDKNVTPLENFLRYQRMGHCEYFATTTALLLRAAGIPSRYTAGYAVQEFSPLENVYVVRKRHAHAWTLAYIDEHWQEFDTTPANWVSIEEENVSSLAQISDIWDFLIYHYSKWRWRDTEESNDWLLWLILPLSVILIWKLHSKEKVVHSKVRLKTKIVNGADSDFYHVVQQLKRAHYIRQPGETLDSWLKRINMLDDNMQTMFKLHQRYRFDPKHMSIQEYTLLKTHVNTWLNTKQH